MQNAPSVIYPVGRSAFYGLCTLVLAGVAGFALAGGWWSAWQASSDSTAWMRWWLGLGVWAGWLVAAARQWKRQPHGYLRWDAQAAPQSLEEPPGRWFWMPEKSADAPEPVAIERAFDGQTVVLLCLHRSLKPDLWVWPQRVSDPVRWDDFRRALVRVH